MNKEVTNRKNYIIDGQLVTSIASIIGILLGIIIIIDQKQKANQKTGFITNEDSQKLALLIKLIFLVITLYSLELNYESYQLSKITNQDTSSLKLQIGASYLSVIVDLIGLYVVLTNYNNTSLQISEIENNFL